MRLAVLDVGSNTVHLLIVDAHYGGAPVPAQSHKIELRLSQNLTSEGLITPSDARELTDFVAHAVSVAEEAGASELSGFATSAIREATNGTGVLDQVAEKTGVRIEVLSGPDEARLTFLAVRRWFGWSSGRLLVMDIGGGSFELAAGLDEEPDEAVSLPLGAGRLTREFLNGDNPDPEAMTAMRKYVRSEVAKVVSRMQRLGKPEMAVATSKTLRQLARVTGAAPSSAGPFVRRVIKREDLDQWLPKLAGMTTAERARLPGVSAGRARQLVAGAQVADAAMDLFNVDELVVCPWALREGVILRRLDMMEE